MNMYICKYMSCTCHVHVMYMLMYYMITTLVVDTYCALSSRCRSISREVIYTTAFDATYYASQALLCTRTWRIFQYKSPSIRLLACCHAASGCHKVRSHANMLDMLTFLLVYHIIPNHALH